MLRAPKTGRGHVDQRALTITRYMFTKDKTFSAGGNYDTALYANFW